MKYWEIKKFVNDHKGVIIGGAIGAVSLIGLGFGIHGYRKNLLASEACIDGIKDDWNHIMSVLQNFDKAGEGCDWYGIAEPGAVWAAFDKDGNLIDAVKDIDGDLISPKMVMVFGDKVEK